MSRVDCRDGNGTIDRDRTTYVWYMMMMMITTTNRMNRCNGRFGSGWVRNGIRAVITDTVSVWRGSKNGVPRTGPTMVPYDPFDHSLD